MALTINTNLSSMIVQQNLNAATSSLNKSIERMTTGYKINHASDNAAGYSIATNWAVQLSSLDVASDNASTGADMLTTLEDNYSLITTHLQRIRDLTEQAANGTYGSDSLTAIQSEIQARLDEIDRISANCEFNGIMLMDGTQSSAINLQVGIDSKASKSQISLTEDLFKSCKSIELFSKYGKDSSNALTTYSASSAVASECAATSSASGMLDKIDSIISEISSRTTALGSAQNRIESAIESINVQTENITSSLSTLRDADVAEESSNYIKAQILQQAAATLLATANQTPSIALNLL